ncbi:putative protein kinase UbiB [Phycisphaerae bacterium RAS1]|nr:putative protein kinase UbiB [Phycisphaerae bacterium RAS1]
MSSASLRYNDPVAHLLKQLAVGSRTYRHFNRYRQILTVLIKHGFGDVVDRLRLRHHAGAVRDGHADSAGPHTPPQRLRRAMEELGPTFIKLGQMLSTRPDLLPAEFADELARLQSEARPFPLRQVREIVERELGRPIDKAFARFDDHALAAASMAQVHRAALPDGSEVVVKVQRPDIRRVVETDLEILLHLATLAERHFDGWRVQRPTRIVGEFTRLIERELDFTHEAAQLERFAVQFAGDKSIYVPRVFHDRLSPHVLTLEYIDGVRASDLDALRAAGLDLPRIAQRGAELTLKQIFEHGFFHADPHPGNIFVLPGEVICLLDFGMMGRIDALTREDFAGLVAAVGQRDAPAAAAALLRLTEWDDDVEPDPRRIERDVSEFLDLHVVSQLSRLDFSRLLSELLTLVNRHRLRIPPDIVTMLKAAATVERLAARLDPTLDMVSIAQPYVARIRMNRFGPRRLIGAAVDAAEQLVHLLSEIPGGVRDLLRMAKRGRLNIGFEHHGLDKLIESNERIANRVSFAIVVSALVIASSLIVHSRIPPVWQGVPLIGVLGYVIAGLMGCALLLAILRHGRL